MTGIYKEVVAGKIINEGMLTIKVTLFRHSVNEIKQSIITPLKELYKMGGVVHMNELHFNQHIFLIKSDTSGCIPVLKLYELIKSTDHFTILLPFKDETLNWVDKLLKNEYGKDI